jgi:hypothetical protein
MGLLHLIGNHQPERTMAGSHTRMLVAAGLMALVCGCSVNRAVPVVIDAPSLSTYLAEHPAANLRVTEHSGRRYWVHAPEVRGDSLVGRHGYDAPARRVGVSLENVGKLETGHFSVGRTGAALGGGLLAVGATLAILIESAQPVY